MNKSAKNKIERLSLLWRPLPAPDTHRVETGREFRTRASATNLTTSSSVVIPIAVHEVTRFPIESEPAILVEKDARPRLFFVKSAAGRVCIQCIGRVGHCGGLFGNFRSWDSYKNLSGRFLFIQSSRYSRLCKYVHSFDDMPFFLRLLPSIS